MRMGLVPGAVVKVRGQSRFGDTVNDNAGVLLWADGIISMLQNHQILLSLDNFYSVAIQEKMRC
jgi:hypothetical protein